MNLRNLIKDSSKSNIGMTPQKINMVGPVSKKFTIMAVYETV